MQIKIKNKKTILKAAIALLIGVFSYVIAYRSIAGSDYIARWTKAIDESRDIVLRLTASSTAASAAITVLPGDVATPLATELAQLGKGFLIVLCALYLEKFIISVAGVVAFQWLIPAACGLYILGEIFQKETLFSLGRKLSLFALALWLVVPASIQISELVKNVYREPINQVIESAENSAEQIQESVGPDRTEEEAGNGLSKIIQNLQMAGDKIANGTSQLIQYFERLLSRFIESIAIMIVISCLIPLLVMAFFAWMIKNFFHLEGTVSIQKLEKVLGRRKEE